MHAVPRELISTRASAGTPARRLHMAAAIIIAAAQGAATAVPHGHGAGGVWPKVQCAALAELDLGTEVTILSAATKTEAGGQGWHTPNEE
eukprot:COSAG02_NODE_710_length_18178_cov_14.361524_1_plen_90_part_00